MGKEHIMVKTTQRYKKRGWFGESYRHYLASKGITTKYDHKKYFYHKNEKNEDDEYDYTDKLEVDDSHMSLYQEHGFENRRDYLNNLAAEHGVDPEVVYALAGALGKNEDFDGLVISIEDAAREGYGDSEYFFKKLNRPTPKMFRVVEKDGKLTEFSFLQDAIKHAEGNKHIIMPDGSIKWIGDSVDGEGFTSRPMYTHKFSDRALELEDDRPERLRLKFGAHKFNQSNEELSTHWKYGALEKVPGETIHEKPVKSVEMNPARLVHSILDNNTERAKQPRERPTTKRVHSFGDAYERPLDYIGEMVK